MKIKIINYSIFIINIYFLIFLKNKKKGIVFKMKKIFKFKMSDYFNIAILNLSYSEISNYLNSKYNINIFINNSRLYKQKRNKFKKILQLYSVDLFNRKKHITWLKNNLAHKFIIKFNPNNPDYLIYNVFGNKHKNQKYKNAIKIAIFTENKIPDLNEADYVLGHAHINYLDRYFKFSILLWENYSNINIIRKKLLNNPIRRKFCAAVISHQFSKENFRIEFLNELNKYKKIDMGGKYKNNVGGRIKNKIDFLSSYKFSIAMENSNGDGYVSEKIIQSYLSGTIPIYYGDYMIDEYINPKSYILIKGKKDIKEKIEYIKKIDNNEELYKSILKENVIIDKNFSNKIDGELRLFLNNIFEQDKSKAYRRNN